MEDKVKQFEALKNLNVDEIVNKEEHPIEYNIISEYKNGNSKKTIHNTLGVSIRRINDTFKKFNIQFRPSGTKPIDEKLAPGIIQKYEQGLSCEKIAKLIGGDPDAILRLLKRHGVTIINRRNSKCISNKEKSE